MSPETDRCLHCGQDSGSVPLIPFHYRGRGYAICSQHLPVLIHDPVRLVGQLPGAESLTPAEHKD
jgi:hypothetical protein